MHHSIFSSNKKTLINEKDSSMNNTIGVMTAMIFWCAVSNDAARQMVLPEKNASAKSQTQSAVKPVDTAKTVSPAPVTSDSLRPDSLAARWGKLRIVSTPDSATVVLDSSEKGRTPAVLDGIAIGQHTILVKKKGYFVKKITVMVNADTAQDISVVLVRPGCVAVRSNPPGARLFVDGKETGFTPWENAKLKPGDLAIRLEYPQRTAVEQRVSVKEGGCDTLTFDLPYSKTYLDSLVREQKQQDVKKRKAKRTANIAVFGAFLIFGIVILFIEASNNK